MSLHHYIHTRLNFGTNSASEIFQKIINEQLRDISGSPSISDDVIVFGKTQSDHDRALHAFFQKFADSNLEQIVRIQQEFNNVFRPDPLQMSPLSPEAWHMVHVDFCGPFPTGEYLFVVIDAYSHFPGSRNPSLHICKGSNSKDGQDFCYPQNTSSCTKR